MTVQKNWTLINARDTNTRDLLLSSPFMLPCMTNSILSCFSRGEDEMEKAILLLWLPSFLSKSCKLAPLLPLLKGVHRRSNAQASWSLMWTAVKLTSNVKPLQLIKRIFHLQKKPSASCAFSGNPLSTRYLTWNCPGGKNHITPFPCCHEWKASHSLDTSLLAINEQMLIE